MASLQKIRCILLLLVIGLQLPAQKEHNNFYLINGYGSDRMMNIVSDSISYYPPAVTMYSGAEKNIVLTGSDGDVLFSTDNLLIYDRYDTIIGSELAQSNPIVLYPPDISVQFESMLALKMDSAGLKYFLIHTIYDTVTYNLLGAPVLYAGYPRLYLTALSFDPVTKRGHVDTLNQILIERLFTLCGMSACQHANGRDWWVVMRERYSNTFFKLLISPDGLVRIDSQSIGPRGCWWGQTRAKFSPFGNYYAVTDDQDNTTTGSDIFFGDRRLQIYYFNRCTGDLSIYKDIDVPDYIPNIYVGPAEFNFSPNENFIYVSYFYNTPDIRQQLVQFNVAMDTSLRLATHLIPFDTLPNFAQLREMESGPDGKIYIETNGMSGSLASVDSPNVAGVACNFQLQGVVFHGGDSAHLESNVHNTHTYYNLGPVIGSPCDTLHKNAIDEVQTRNEEGISISPNPASSKTIISAANWKAAFYLSLYDIQGNLIHNNLVARNNQEITLSSSLASGMYFWKATRSGQILANGKLLKE
jgi:hypothetical protein